MTNSLPSTSSPMPAPATSVSPPNTSDSIVVPLGHIAITTGNHSLHAERVSTGVVVVMAWADHQLGGMAHVALPGGTPLEQNEMLTVAQALPELLTTLTAEAETQQLAGATPDKLTLWLAGGAQLFAFGGGHSTLNVGVRNVETVHQWVTSQGLTLANEAIAGNRGRNVAYYPQEHQCWVTPLGSDSAQL